VMKLPFNFQHSAADIMCKIKLEIGIQLPQSAMKSW
jgi:hypothetical protein